MPMPLTRPTPEHCVVVSQLKGLLDGRAAASPIRTHSPPHCYVPPAPPPIPDYPFTRTPSPQSPADGEERTTGHGHHFRVREQIWDDRYNDWVLFVPRAPRNFGDALFVVSHRRYSRRDDEEVFTVFDVLDTTLVETLREVCKNLENVFSSRPSLSAKSLYPYIEALIAHAEDLEADEDDDSAPLRSFLEILVEEFKPDREKMERLLAEGKITFEFLWTVFKPSLNIRAKHPSSRAMMGAVVDEARENNSNSPPTFHLRGRTLVWTGTKYEFQPWTHDIPTFFGPMNLSDLEVAIMKDIELEELTERGRKYVQFTGIQHVEVSSTMLEPNNFIFGETPSTGRAILDTVAYRQPRPNMQPSQDWGQWNQWSTTPTYIPPASPQMYGSRPAGSRRSKKKKRSTSGPTENPEKHEPLDHVPEEMLWMLPPTLPGYSFVAKKWGEFRVSDIQKVIYDEQAWERLVLDADTKTLIRSLVYIHSNASSTPALMSDWIKGKGGGLVVLLHGVAGVGKTLTAEAVAELLHRPLYVVGAGELGGSPTDVENALRAALDLAKSWGAVLLIDEADVFLERRANADLVRNAMVATFLRLLEYHSGMLFLTTNRVRAFDEAFLSRVSVAIKYPELDIQQRGKIWFQFLTHVLGSGTSEVLQDENLKELAMKPFNGRIIKNIVRTAQALALSSQETLAMRHLRTVIVVTEKFLHDTEDMRDDATVDPSNEVVSLVSN